MNRSLTNVLFGGITPTTASTETHEIKGSITQTTVDETVEALANADSVILVSRIIKAILPLTEGYRWSDMAWLSPKLSMQFLRSQLCSERRESMFEYGSTR